VLYSFLNKSEMSVQDSLEGFKIFPANNQKNFVGYKKFCGSDKACNSYGSIQYFVQGWCQSPWLQCTPSEEKIRGAPSAQRLSRYVEIKCQLDATEAFYCRYYCLLNMFRAQLCPSSGAQEYYTLIAACGVWCCAFQVVGLVWS
jgi:hypothetical protein